MRVPLSLRRSPAAIRAVPHVNLLPTAYRRPPLLTLRRGLVLLIVAELLIGAYVLQTQGEAARSGVRQFFQSLRGERPAAELRLENLRSQAATLEKELEQIRAARKEFRERKTDWPAAISAIFAATPKGVVITAVRESGDAALVNGLAESLEQVNAFRTRLVETGVVRTAAVTTLAHERATGKSVFGMTLGMR